MRNTQISAAIGTITDGVIGTLTDFLLLSLYNIVCSSTVRTMYDADRAIDDAHRMLDTVNYQTIKKTLSLLSQKGLITRTRKHSSIEFAITKSGLKRINEIVPTYRTDRPWDGHIYLISYDIPNRNNRSRDTLREYIRRTGGALLQESLWINPYNPTLLLENFARSRDIPGTILVSKLGLDGTIGDDRLPDLIARMYRYKDLTDRYNEFLATYPVDHKKSPMNVRLAYMAILHKDPQLPFPLEPQEFPAKKAWDRYLRLTMYKML